MNRALIEQTLRSQDVDELRIPALISKAALWHETQDGSAMDNLLDFFCHAHLMGGRRWSGEAVQLVMGPPTHPMETNPNMLIYEAPDGTYWGLDFSDDWTKIESWSTT